MSAQDQVTAVSSVLDDVFIYVAQENILMSTNKRTTECHLDDVFITSAVANVLFYFVFIDLIFPL